MAQVSTNAIGNILTVEIEDDDVNKELLKIIANGEVVSDGTNWLY